ncbi:hypothetical protein ACFFRR_009160 [Megaselia abdita]
MLTQHLKKCFILLILISKGITHCEQETCSKDDSSDSCSQLIVETLEGKVRGSFLKSTKGREFYAFRRIPYAEPPINEKRFKLAERKQPWDDILDATKSSKVCPQPEILHRRSQMSEDCLYLNVYTRRLSKVAPVIVYIHSGLYYFGSGHIDLAGPQYLMDSNVVLVTLNYRLGALGLASTKGKDIPGNLALKDIVLGLKWIQANIENFGGDASKVTIMGGMAANDLVISPMARDLFHKAVIMGEASTTHSKANNKELTKLLGENIHSSWEKIIETCASWNKKYFIPRLFFKPEAEVDFGQERIFKKHPRALMSSGEFAKVPILIGMTKHEYEYLGEVLYEDDYFIKDFHTNFEDFAPFLFDYKTGYTRSHVKNITNAIKVHYFKNRNKYNSDNKRYIGEALSDLYVTHGVNRFISYARKFKGNVFAYQFDYQGKYTLALGMGKDKVKGVFHGDDLMYILQSRKHKFFTSDVEYKMVEKMTNILAHFADTGNPNYKDISVQWEPTTKYLMTVMIINERLTPSKDFAFDSGYEEFDRIFNIK